MITSTENILNSKILKYLSPMDIVHWTYARKAILFGIPKIFINSITSFYKDIYLKNIQDKFCFNVPYIHKMHILLILIILLNMMQHYCVFSLLDQFWDILNSTRRKQQYIWLWIASWIGEFHQWRFIVADAKIFSTIQWNHLF